MTGSNSRKSFYRKGSLIDSVGAFSFQSMLVPEEGV